ncbi:Pre-mRNA-splicing factor sap61 [Polyrhizophydium stewartii]|uniref:Pre-mRNA-splicing factor sap61 n=1 Tax=Polyrhizophydium stewartii TaxID=2732419 RepID=A0ABR4NJ85_9FUNG|nr:hypothetical protein HK105_000329 [Polyrhizophydium stewartii]
MAGKSQYLLDMYRDEDGQVAGAAGAHSAPEHILNLLLLALTARRRSRQREIELATATSDFSEFYERLRRIKEYHRRMPNEAVRPLDTASLAKDPEVEVMELENDFTGEEGFGRYFDLHDSFNAYINLKNVKKMPYLAYLAEFDRFSAVPMETRRSPAYLEYLETMRKYFESFFKRAKPLFNFEELRRSAILAFEKDWAEDSVDGWPFVIPEAGENEDGNESAQLYCLACDKTFAKKTVFESHKTGKKHIKAAAALAEKGVVLDAVRDTDEVMRIKARQDHEKCRPTALAETLILKYVKQLSSEREDTKMHSERKQALTDRERMAEKDEEEVEVVSEEEDDEGRIYNPLNLPLDWDGKPIPYWLYKLHGLGIKYPCEICGNEVYMGRKAFQNHFQEWRHMQGMRALGIPNTKDFQDVTLINDALALAEKIKQSAKQAAINPEVVEEFEDDSGNVYNKKTFEDLRRQGLL